MHQDEDKLSRINASIWLEPYSVFLERIKLQYE